MLESCPDQDLREVPNAFSYPIAFETVIVESDGSQRGKVQQISSSSSASADSSEHSDREFPSVRTPRWRENASNQNRASRGA